jgi:hypothetical protein
MAVQIQLRNDTSINWENINPILSQGEIGIENDTRRFKLGNGVNRWIELPYNVNDVQTFLESTNGLYNLNNIGIGTTNPTNKLSVLGNSDITGTLTVDTISSSNYIGDGSSLLNITNVKDVIYVSKDGNDENDGKTIGKSKLTIKSAVSVATEGTVIRVFPGIYVENNPINLPNQISIVGSSLREVTVTPQNQGDLFYVGNGNYICDMSFVGPQNSGAIVSFNPNDQRYIDQSTYVQNCTNFIPGSIGMKIDGKNAIGPLKSMVVDSYTQYNQGGIGVSITNEGYAQLVSLFTICCDTSVYTASGGQCDLTNSNSSFGNYALVSNGVGPIKYIGDITSVSPENSSTFSVNLSSPTLSISTATYNNPTGFSRITTTQPHGFSEGMSVNLRDLEFQCKTLNATNAVYDNVSGIVTITTSELHNYYEGFEVRLDDFLFECKKLNAINSLYDFRSGITTITTSEPHKLTVGSNIKLSDFQFTCRTLNVIGANYDNVSGIATITTSQPHNFYPGFEVKIEDLQFTCEGVGGVAFYPSGEYGYIFSIRSVITPTVFTVDVGTSETPGQIYVSGGTVKNAVVDTYGNSILYPSGEFGFIFPVLEVNSATSFVVNTGISSTPNQVYVTGGFIENAIVDEYGDSILYPSGNSGYVFDIKSINSSTSFSVNVGVSSIPNQIYVSGGTIKNAVVDTYGNSILYPSGDKGYIFEVQNVVSPTEFDLNVGVSSTPNQIYVSGGTVKNEIVAPYAGQVVYFGQIYYELQSVKIISGGFGYTSIPTVTIDSPDGPSAVPAKARSVVENGVVTSVNVLRNGRNYTSIPNITISSPEVGGTAVAVAIMKPIYYNIDSSNEVLPNVYSITVSPEVPFAVGVGTSVPFARISKILASGQSLEYIGSGTSILNALPIFGGKVKQDNEIDMRNGGSVIFTSTDQSGNFRIGDGVVIDQTSGTIGGQSFTRGLYAQVTPLIIALQS